MKKILDFSKKIMPNKSMRYEDLGIIINIRPCSERTRLVTIFTQERGRYTGLISISNSRNSPTKSLLQLGQSVQAVWTSRSPDGLGFWKLESLFSPLGLLMHRPGPLMALNSACTFLHELLPVHHPYEDLYHTSLSLIQSLSHDGWVQAYVSFEVELLKQIGFGLSLSRCAVTGKTENLRYVSPKTGCAVTEEVGQPYHELMLPFSKALVYAESLHPLEEYRKALIVTGYFLKHQAKKEFPFRDRFLEIIQIEC